MSLIDTIKETVTRIIPQKESSIPKPVDGSIEHGEEMIVPKRVIVAHAAAIFFSFVALCCFASVASFQAKFGVGPSGLSGFALFIALMSLFIASFMVSIPVINEKYDKFVRLARAMEEVRVVFILAGTGLTLTFLISFITTISAWTQPGCKNKDDDPNASKGDDFKNGLPDWCSTKKAGAFFFWFATIAWVGTMTFCVLAWRAGEAIPRRDPNFNPPSEMRAHEDDDDDDDESRYGHTPSGLPNIRRSMAEDVVSPFSDENRYRPDAESRPRPSLDAYGAFSDPAPIGFGAPVSPSTAAGVSRTMQYADPYAAVRANLGASQMSPSQPPSYEYQGYR